LHFQAAPADHLLSTHQLTSLSGAFALPDQAAWLRFNQDDVPRLQEQGWEIDKSPAYRFDVAEIDDWYAEIDEANGQPGNAWFDLELGIVVNQERVSLLPLLINLIRQAPHDFDPRALAQRDDNDELLMRLDSGVRVALPWGRIKPILNTLGELYFTDKLNGDAVRLSALDAARLAELEGSAHMRWMGGERLRQIGHKLNTFGGVQAITMPDGLQATLRDYQMEGVAWMQFLREYDFAGILADDMGLGKTVQTLTHILIEKNAGRLTAPALVVAPTSLMVNWKDEAEKFAPSLKVLVLQGKQRIEHFVHIAEYDVVLTTYALLPRDEEKLREHAFHLLILDEAHYIKNARSKAAQSASLIKANHRLCLTGTPLENHLGELWSQFHFLLPGLLGDEKTFNRDFRQPIEKHGDEARRALLVRRIKPFLLRRTKDKVASELPPKTEMVRTVELVGAQRDLYETVRLAMDKKVRTAIASKGVARSHIIILEALLKLRQACCDPRLVKMSAVAAKAAGIKATVKHAPSAKLQELMEMVQELREEDRRILIFSQFTSMLELIAQELTAAKIGYTMLTGDTQDRASVVRAFQQGEVPIFLISLKAGGVGLNLTTADTVIHYDPWWNPAAENQATDRAWRILSLIHISQ
ncbi:MAG: SNF2-related protein, partial [Glaciimonas sp.]|nr:SNF2-related protein [Glaciimonas sp.]